MDNILISFKNINSKLKYHDKILQLEEKYNLIFISYDKDEIIKNCDKYQKKIILLDNLEFKIFLLKNNIFCFKINEEFEFDKLLLNPSNYFRPVPFWFWNGLITKEEILRQLNLLKYKGLGGAFIAPRQGLEIPYLSNQWFELINYTILKAKELNLDIYLYDEYPYPSGIASNEVIINTNSKDKRLEYIYQINNKFDITLPMTKIIYAKAFDIKDNNINYQKSLNLLNDIGIIQEEEILQESGLTTYNSKRYFSFNPQKRLMKEFDDNKLLVIFYIKEIDSFKYFNTYIDTFDINNTKEFINSTHKKYQKNINLKDIKGFFSDEIAPLSRLPWTNDFDKIFYVKNNYDLIDNLLGLIDYHFPNSYKIRYDYLNTLHNLFKNNYHKQISNFCSKNNLLYFTEVPSFRLSTEEFSDVIGGDTSHEKINEKLDDINNKYLLNYRSNAKAIVSLKRQLNKPYAMVEAFHSVGWSMTLQDQKWMVDRLASQGINFLNFHAFYYTTNSIVKYDAPPSQFYQNPYFENYKVFADYASRLNLMNTLLIPTTHICILDPIPSFWCLGTKPVGQNKYIGFFEEEKNLFNKIQNDFLEISKRLMYNQINYDHIDTEILIRGKIEKNKIILNNNEAVYDTIIIPPTLSLEGKALDFINKFKKVGKVYYLGLKPLFNTTDNNFNNSNFNNILSDYLNHNINYELDNIIKDIKSNEKISIDIIKNNDNNFLSNILKNNKDEYYIFITNQNNVNSSININFLSNYKIVEYDLFNGKIKKDCSFNFKGYESKLYKLIFKNNYFINKNKIIEKKVVLNELTNLKLLNNNFYPLDNFCININNKKYKVKPDILINQIKLDKKNIINKESNFGIPYKLKINYPLNIVYTANFYVQDKIEELFILIDKDTIKGKYKFYLNNHEIFFEPKFIYDNENMVSDITNILKIGNNNLKISLEANKDYEGIRSYINLYGKFSLIKNKENGSKYILTKSLKAFYNNKYFLNYPYYVGKYSFEKVLSLNKEDQIINLILEIKNLFDTYDVYLNNIYINSYITNNMKLEIKKEMIKDNNVLKIIGKTTLVNLLEKSYFDYNKHKLIKI